MYTQGLLNIIILCMKAQKMIMLSPVTIRNLLGTRTSFMTYTHPMWSSLFPVNLCYNRTCDYIYAYGVNRVYPYCYKKND